jgi:hypothetical protein
MGYRPCDGKSCLYSFNSWRFIMAFTPATSAAAQTIDNWKAQGFLNFYLPSKDGGRKKLGAIPLKEAKPNEKTLLAWLNEDPAHVQVLMNKLEVEYQSAVPSEGSGFDL